MNLNPCLVLEIGAPLDQGLKLQELLPHLALQPLQLLPPSVRHMDQGRVNVGKAALIDPDRLADHEFLPDALPDLNHIVVLGTVVGEDHAAVEEQVELFRGVAPVVQVFPRFEQGDVGFVHDFFDQAAV